MIYRRGKVYWYEFVFSGARIRESAKTTSKTIAREAERARRRELELGINGLTKRERPPLFPAAAKQWFESKTALSPLGKPDYSQYITKLTRHFGIGSSPTSQPTTSPHCSAGAKVKGCPVARPTVKSRRFAGSSSIADFGRESRTA